MAGRWLRSWTNAAFAIALGLFIVSLGIATHRLVKVEQTMREDLSDNLLWHVSQSQLEVTRLADALHRLAVNEPAPGLLLERYEVAARRVRAFADGRLRERLEHFGGIVAMLPEGAETLERLAPAFDAIAAGDRSQMGDVLAVVDPLVLQLRLVANTVLQDERDRDRAFRDERQVAQLWFLTSMLGVILCGAWLIASLSRALRRSRALSAQAAAAESAARQSAERFRDIVDAASDWIWETDAEHRFSFLSYHLQELSGERPAEIIGKNRFDLYAGADEMGLWARHRQELAAHKPFRDFVFPHYDARHRLRYARVHGKPVFAADGTFQGYRGTGRDITPEIESARALEENRNLLQTVIDGVPAIINVKDTDGRYVFINRYQGQVFGVEPEKAVGLSTGEVLGDELTPFYAALDRQVAETGIAVPFTERTFGGAGTSPETTWLHSKQPIKDPDGRTKFILTVGLDITELKKAERARTNLSRHFSPNMVDELIGMDSSLERIRSQNVAALFIDMVGFTEMCIALPAVEAFNVLRDYHARISSVVLAHDGTIDKYMGDGIMATFGTPQMGPQDATNALRCAREMLRVIDAWNAERIARREFTVEAGIGIHYGPVLMGLVGDERRVEFAVVGDTINIASRLEDMTRVRGVSLVTSEEFVAKVVAENVAAPADLAGLAPAGREVLRGRKTSTAIWTLTASARAELSRAVSAAD
ncbi:MAG: adenylate/guanylate cyclase domain-containing protein [Alphaproteobacteria bacterium]